MSGLGGSLTGGGISGFYDTYKTQAARKAAALANKDPQAYYNADSTGTGIINSLAGSVPVLGSITNVMAYKDRLNAEKDLAKLSQGK